MTHADGDKSELLLRTEDQSDHERYGGSEGWLGQIVPGQLGRPVNSATCDVGKASRNLQNGCKSCRFGQSRGVVSQGVPDGLNIPQQGRFRET